MTGMASRALEILQKTYGYPSFRGAQAEIIEHVIAGQNAFVLMPTGGGQIAVLPDPGAVPGGGGRRHFSSYCADAGPG